MEAEAFIQGKALSRFRDIKVKLIESYEG